MNDWKSISSGLYTWIGWVLASALGAAVGAAAAFNLLNIMSRRLSMALNEVLIFGLILLGMGALQWLVLRSRIAQAGWWIGASIASGTLLGIMATKFSYGANGPLGDGLFGITLVVPYWLVLRRQLSYSWLWLIASPVAWALAYLAVSALERSGIWPQMTEINELIFAFGVIGAVVGMITGLLLVWLLRHTYLPVNSPRGYKSA
jgi:hypothetical protein